MSDLESLLAAAATDPVQAPAFLVALLDAQVVVAGQTQSSPGQAESGTRSVTLAPLTRADGTSVQPFFTSEARLKETLRAIPGYEARNLTIRCRDLWEMTRGSSLVLNPHSAYGKEFLPDEIAHLLDGSAAMTPHVISEATRVLVGQPAHVPDGMEDRLRALCADCAAVEAAYLGWKVTPDTGDQSYLLVFVGPPTVSAQINDDLGRALVLFSRAHPVDVLFAAPGEDHLLTSIEPIYVRKAARRGLFRR